MSPQVQINRSLPCLRARSSILRHGPLRLTSTCRESESLPGGRSRTDLVYSAQRARLAEWPLAGELSPEPEPLERNHADQASTVAPNKAHPCRAGSYLHGYPRNGLLRYRRRHRCWCSPGYAHRLAEAGRRRQATLCRLSPGRRARARRGRAESGQTDAGIGRESGRLASLFFSTRAPVRRTLRSAGQAGRNGEQAFRR